MSALSDYLDAFNRLAPPSPSFAGIITHTSGPPGDDTSPFYMFAHDDVNDKTYMNPSRTAGAWVELADAAALTGTIITGTI